MSKYYLVRYKNIEEKKKIINEVEVNTERLEVAPDIFCNASLLEFNETYYYDGKQKNRSIKFFTIVEYNELEDKYYDIITGYEYVNYEYNSRLRFLKNVKGNLVLELGYNLPSKTVVNLLEEINFNDERVEAYATTMKVLNKMNNDDKYFDTNSEYYIESFKRRYRRK